jgi:GNAT superfamily N-acetyltransferase
MTLDLSRIRGQIEAMSANLRQTQARRQERRARALQEFSRQAADLEPLRRKVEQVNGERFPWPVASLVEEWDRCYPMPPLPSAFVVLASDGSQIDMERHNVARCYLINVGKVMLRYGANPDAQLSSQATLFYKDEALFITDPQNGHRRVPLDSTILRIRRSIMECQALAELARSVASVTPTLALLDGSLIRWDLAAKGMDELVRNQLLPDFLSALGELWELNRETELALASYISRPSATEVVNALRLAVCQRGYPNCQADCPTTHPTEGRRCDEIASGVLDADLFRERLAYGERSPLFRSNSPILKRYEGHHVYFLYLNVGEEIARVEVPAWVAASPERLDLAHVLVVDQARRGQGYPAALTEAHEQAVVRASDRQEFWALLEEALLEQRMEMPPSPKGQSKRVRGI